MNAPFILASASPRRVEILRQICIADFGVVPADIDETPLKAETPQALVVRLAAGKAQAISALHPDARILGADTVVALGRRILGKPADEADARRMLKLISGRRHRVVSGIALVHGGALKTRCVETTVRVKTLSASDIDAYIAMNEWEGKAGGYGIQGAFAAYVPFISGSYSNIVGLCAPTVAGLLKAM